APPLALSPVLRQRPLATDGRRGLLASPIVRAERAVDIVKPYDPSLEPVVLAIVPALAFGEELFPTVPVLGVGRVGVLFLQGLDVRGLLTVARIHARRRRVEVPLDAIEAGSLEHMRVDEHVVVHALGLVRLDESDAAHVRRKIIDLVNSAGRLQAATGATYIKHLELVPPGWR